MVLVENVFEFAQTIEEAYKVASLDYVAAHIPKQKIAKNNGRFTIRVYENPAELQGVLMQVE